MKVGVIAAKAKAAFAYFRARLDERSTLTGLVAAIGTAAIIPPPWCYFSFLIGAVAVLMPSAAPK